ncbi:HNH endonuclease [Variovorax ginsengisoli]|uniref:HNH endonuclease n=1 Tax=Variovorax ginsengisoli TaxID=363844 RepID=A0ABT8S3K1_9BURK|nr:HNH endonuclease [Variovorax ginsengisoli]MDN8612766.1 HNH endonuclease [Variovorax ginsengisoli]MDO1531936.1 HNH endonuclease [Variovorax ginsengisoli]
MSEGAYLLERICSYSHEDGDCLVWDRYCNGHMPVINVDGAPRPVRRVVFGLAVGPIKPGHEVIHTCKTLKCVAPEHLEQITAAKRRTMMAALRNGRGQAPSQVRYMREKHGKLSIEKAREIRASDELGKVLAARFGVTPQLISLVRTGKSWAEPSPFAGLGAR